MTASPADRRHRALRAAGAAALLLLALGSPAFAQGVVYGKQGIEVDQLEAVDPESVGVLTEAPASLGIDLWRGAERARVVDLVRNLPHSIESPSLHALTRRLLLTAARAPAAGQSAIQTLTAARLSTLIAMGATGDALSLLGAAGARSRGEAVARIELDALLLDGETERACEAAGAGAGRYTSSEWQYAVAYCRALSGDHAGARLAVDLVRDSGSGDIDPLNGPLVEAMLGGKGPNLRSMGPPSPLQLAMIGAAKLPLPRSAVPSDRPDLLRAAARMADLPPELRVDAAEQAVTVNAIGGDTLAEIYGKTDLPAGKGWNAAARAAGWRKVSSQADTEAQARALQELLETGRKRGGWRPLAAASMSFTDALRADPGRMWLAEEATRALLISGRVVEARDWYYLAMQGSGPEAGPAQTRLWPLVRMADTENRFGWSDATLDAWWRQTKASAGKAAGAQATLLYSLLAGVGDPVSQSAWADVPQDAGKALSPQGAQAAAALGGSNLSRGETVALAIIVLGEVEQGRVDQSAIRTALGALRRAGLAAEARAIAVEIALDAGL